ncbi:MAG: transposase [Treponema sp.]|nr:transposase [Treponema sp.]
MDNARFHRKKELWKTARGKVRLLFLPPYSSDYNSYRKNMGKHEMFPS